MAQFGTTLPDQSLQGAEKLITAALVIAALLFLASEALIPFHKGAFTSLVGL